MFDPDGALLSLPVEWTDDVAEDPLEVVAAGRSPFRTEGLLELADLVARLHVERSTNHTRRVKRITPCSATNIVGAA